MKTESDLFDYLKKHVYPDLLSSGYDVFAGTDCASYESKHLIELKCRGAHYKMLLIEKAKFDVLVDNAERTGFEAWYINSTPMGIYGWKITREMDLTWERRVLPETSQFKDTGSIIKTVSYLKVIKADFKKEGVGNDTR